MCKTWTTKYGCGHCCTFRLSVCRGTNTVLTKHYHTKISCSGDACFTLQDTQFCGDCARRDAEELMREEQESLRLRLRMRARRASIDITREPSEAMVQAERDFEQRLWALNRQFPDSKHKRIRTPKAAARGTARATRGSLLKREVSAEDVVDKAHPGATGGWDAAEWEPGWTSLSDELSSEEASAEILADAAGDSIEDWLAAANNADGDHSQEDEEPPRTAPTAKPSPEAHGTEGSTSPVIPPHRKALLSARISAPDRRPPSTLSPLMELAVR